MKRLFTFLMTTLVLLVVSTQGAKAFEYWIMGDLAHNTTGKWDKVTCKGNDENKFVSNGSIHTYTFTAENTTSVWFRIAPGDGYKEKEMLYPSGGQSISITEGTSYNVGYIESTDKSWGINVTAGQAYEITLDETDTNNRKVSYKKVAAQYVLNIDGIASSWQTNGEFTLDLTSATANTAITFTVDGESYGLSTPATVSEVGTTYWSFASGNTNALTLSKGLSYTLTLTPTTRAAKAAASAYTLTVVATAPTFDDYYMLGRVGNGENWSDNSSGLKFTTTDGKIYTRSVLCTADNSDFSFRIGTPDNSASQQLYPEGCPSVPQTTATGGIHKGQSNNYWKLGMTANNLYTFTLDMTDANNPTLKYEVEAVSGEYEMVATCGAEELVLPLTKARRRDSKIIEDNLWTVGFKDELLKGKVGDVSQVYIRDKKSHRIQFRPAVTTDGYGNFDSKSGSSRVDNLALDYSNLLYFGNAAYADPTSGSTNTFSITKGKIVINGEEKKAMSHMLMLNLGDKISENSAGSGNITFEHKAQSVSLFAYGSLSDMYKKMADAKISSYGYDEKKEDFYLIGKIYEDKYTSNKKPTGTNNNKMVRQIYYNPIHTELVDSIVYSKIVKRPADASSYDGIFLSFVPAFFYESGMDFLDDSGNIADKYKQTKTNQNPFNYVARAATFDDKDATAPYGTVMVHGACTGQYTGKYADGEQAINPLLSPEQQQSEYYIVRLNVTTSTYRIEFVKKQPVTLTRLQTFCNQANLKLEAGMHAYAVQEFVADKSTSGTIDGRKQGVLKLRSLKYIPANEGVVLYCENIKEGETDNSITFDVLTDADESTQVTDVKENWWNKSYSGDTYKNCLVASLFGTTIENGDFTINEQGKYTYHTRNFALNKFYKTKYYLGLSDEEKKNYPDNYYGFFRAKGNVPKGRAYLKLSSDQLSFNGQFLDHEEDDGDPKTFAKMSLFFDDLGGEITGIQEVNANVTPREDGAYYTLQGMKVEKPVKGLYIHNGKKVIIK